MSLRRRRRRRRGASGPSVRKIFSMMRSASPRGEASRPPRRPGSPARGCPRRWGRAARCARPALMPEASLTRLTIGTGQKRPRSSAVAGHRKRVGLVHEAGERVEVAAAEHDGVGGRGRADDDRGKALGLLPQPFVFARIRYEQRFSLVEPCGSMMSGTLIGPPLPSPRENLRPGPVAAIKPRSSATAGWIDSHTIIFEILKMKSPPDRLPRGRAGVAPRILPRCSSPLSCLSNRPPTLLLGRRGGTGVAALPAAAALRGSLSALAD